MAEQQPAAAAAAAAAAAPEDGGRQRRQRTTLAITDEALMWVLQNESLGNDSWPLPRSKKAQPRPKASAASGSSSHSRGTGVGAANGKQQRQGQGQGEAAGSTPRPAKRIKATPVVLVNGGTAARSGSSTLADSLGQGSSEEGESSGEEGEDGSDDPAAQTAWQVGLNATHLVEEEAGLLPPGASEATYVRVRNEVLCMWRRDVSQRLTEEAAIAGMTRPEERPYALAAHRFLSATGYINFGVSPAQHRHLATAPQNAGSVLVVGAGCAGLAAARQLRAAGYRVAVVEGRDRPGGRVWSERLEARGACAVADIGGSIITGIDGNPLAVVAKQMRLPLADIDSENVPLYFADGSEPDPALDSAVEALHNDLLAECTDLKAFYEGAGGDTSLGASLESLWDANKAQLPGLVAKSGGNRGAAAAAATAQAARRLFDWHLSNLEFANSCQVDTLSLRHWDQDDPHELLGAHCFVPGCNGRWLQELCRELPVFYSSPVREIRHCATGVAVQTDQHCFEADAVVVTVPLGVLKRPDAIRFTPALTERKLKAIGHIGFGSMNKVILLFPHAFWGDQLDMFGHIADSAAERGEAFLFYSYTHISGGALLIALCSGEAAVKLEQRTPAEAAERVMRVLRAIYETRGVQVPPALQVMTTRWGSDPFAYGSYSSMAVGTRGGGDYDTLAESLGGRVFFAGEATNRKYPATMHGAFMSGLAAAANVQATLRQREQPEGAASAKAAASAAERAGRQRTSSQSQPQDLLLAAAAMPLTAAEQAVAAQDVDQASMLASQLQQLFADTQHPPEWEAAGVAVIHAPPGWSTGSNGGGGGSTNRANGGLSGSERNGSGSGGGGNNGGSAGAGHAAAAGSDQQSLLRLDLAALGKAKRKARRWLGEGFLVVSRKVAEEVCDAQSVDARLALLEALPECRFATRQAAQAAALAAAVRTHRVAQDQPGRMALVGQQQHLEQQQAPVRQGHDEQREGAQRSPRCFLIPRRK